MAQRAGELCHRVTVQHKTTVYDEYNYETEDWTEFKSSGASWISYLLKTLSMPKRPDQKLQPD